MVELLSSLNPFDTSGFAQGLTEYLRGLAA
jgi:hypothetical protein